MSQGAMNVDQPQVATKVRTLQNLTTTTPLVSSVSSRCIPSDKDFLFYNTFDEFKNPIHEITKKPQPVLENIATDGAYQWLVNVNDDVFQRFNVSLDECQGIRKKEEETGRPTASLADSENGFQLVYGRKKKVGNILEPGKEVELDSGPASGVKMATRDIKTTGQKPKVPFHIPTIRRPQDEYNILVNNSNQPFDHVWLQRSDDGQRFIHPLEKLSVLDFVKDYGNIEPIKPPSIECTPFKVVKDVKDLKELAAKLRAVNEFAVDLEHNQYRSFQGLTCLMQISTRTEDFVLDTLKLRIHVGPYLREIFKDPTKRKVMHGADRDILWLQRDFGIYICNLFDTGQVDKSTLCRYQNADWRLRPLPNEMLRYAREDTHYLLYIYDLMRMKLCALSKETQSSDTPLVEVFKLSYDVCIQLYEKELLTENSYLYTYGLQGAGFNAQQLAIVSGLFEWRDIVARAEDESTGYVLPNKTLLEIAKQMPVSTSKLRKLIKSKHPYVECNYDSIVSIVIHSMQNASAFEAVAKKLKEGRATNASSVIPDKYGTEALLPKMPSSKITNARKESIGVESAKSPISFPLRGETLQHQNKCEQLIFESNSCTSGFLMDNLNISQQNRDANIGTPSTAKGYGTNVQVLKRPSLAFGALLGNSTFKSKLNPDEKGKEDIKIEKIRSSVNLPFYSFLGSNDKSRLVIESPSVACKHSEPQKPIKVPENMTCNKLESINELKDKRHSQNESRLSKKTREPSGLLQLKPRLIMKRQGNMLRFEEDAEEASSHSDMKILHLCGSWIARRKGQ
ncbi:protein RRP6-like 2 isoform X1 [Senna tora]|uniref:Protein RRP6-like 2 isoform X1 n=1 Tax=Senna tora TaxID=362788 RepID=A0A834TBR4_9FABA|nr:protein RRP6-like 2 isoform X1 [Senna tora]